jgi:hypothetical protein
MDIAHLRVCQVLWKALEEQSCTVNELRTNDDGQSIVVVGGRRARLRVRRLQMRPT